MKYVISRLIALLFVSLSLGLGVAHATLLDFEDLSAVGQGGSVAFNRYQASGVVFDSSISYGAYNHPAGGANTAGWSLYNATNTYGDISGTFTSPVNFMSILVGDWCCDFDQATLSVFDSSNHLLATSSGSGDSWFTLSVSASGISRFSIASSGAVLYDNLSFSDTNRVPEPATLALLGLGVLGIAASRRRAKAQ